MADLDNDLFSEHDKTKELSYTGETIPFTIPILIKAPSWEPERET